MAFTYQNCYLLHLAFLLRMQSQSLGFMILAVDGKITIKVLSFQVVSSGETLKFTDEAINQTADTADIGTT